MYNETSNLCHLIQNSVALRQCRLHALIHDGGQSFLYPSHESILKIIAHGYCLKHSLNL